MHVNICLPSRIRISLYEKTNKQGLEMDEMDEAFPHLMREQPSGAGQVAAQQKQQVQDG